MAAARRRACLATLRASQNPKAPANPFRTVLACSAGAWAISSRWGLYSVTSAQRTQFPIEVIAGLVQGAMKQKTIQRGANGKEYRT